MSLATSLERAIRERDRYEEGSGAWFIAHGEVLHIRHLVAIEDRKRPAAAVASLVAELEKK